jgi:beta-glucosidase
MIAHGMGDEEKVSELAINAGIDMDMVSELFIKYGANLVKSGKVSEAQIDAACRRVLEAKYKLGLFHDPYRYISEERRKQELMSADKLQLAKEAAIKSQVLLKNSGKILPLSAQKKVAFIGPLVKDQRNVIGAWSGAGEWKEATSLWQALDTKFGANKFLYAKGCNLIDDAELIKRLNVDGALLDRDEKTPQSMINEAVSTAQQADVVVAVLGEPFIFSGEAASRSLIGLPDNQVALLKALKATGKPIALVLMNGRPLTLPWENANLDAILETWYGGTKSGDAIVETLFGDANPSGKLSITFPVNVGQIPIYYNAKNTGRPYVPNEKYHSQYLDVPNEPLYPFGYGLSYTTFDYSEPQLSQSTMTPAQSITVSTRVKNTGDRTGTETVQFYIRDLVGSITRPVKELKHFQKVELKPGEEKTVEYKLSVDDLKFYDSDLKYVAEPGEFEVFCGVDSSNLKKAKFVLR